MRITARIAKGANAENACIATTCADLARMAQSDCSISSDAPGKVLARFLTERDVQTPSRRSTTWQATTVHRMKACWGVAPNGADHMKRY